MSVVADVCLYGSPASGYAFLTLQGAHAIASRGGWNARENAPSGELRSLSDTIEQAKASLRALGMATGDVRVFFPGGEHATRTRIDVREPVSAMTIGPAPRTIVTATSLDAAARAIAEVRDKERYADRWSPEYVTWYRRSSPSQAPELVSVLRGDLVWIATERGALNGVGTWRIARGFEPKTRSIQVGELEWAPLPRVYTRQEAVAAGIAPPRAPAQASHAPYPLLIDALALARGRTLELTAEGRAYRLRVAEVARSWDTITRPRSTSIAVVDGTIDGTRAELLLPTAYDEGGAPLEPAELRWGPQRRAVVDPASVRFTPTGRLARRSARLPAERTEPAEVARPKRSASRTAPREPAPVETRAPELRATEPRAPVEAPPSPTPADEWSRTAVVWHRPSRKGPPSRIEHRLGDLVWASYGGSSPKKGVWGRIEGFSAARQAIQVREQWRALPLLFTYDEALALGIEPPRAPAPRPKRPDAPFPRLFFALRRSDARGATLEVTTTKGKAYAIRIRRVDEDIPRALVVVGAIEQRDGTSEPVRLTVWTDTDAAGFAKALSVLHRGARSETVDPLRMVLRTNETVAGGAS